jgi:riboflavin kinase/FMN adenylyltransferase
MLRHSNLPVGGVYAATVRRCDGERLHGVVNVGFRPTVGGMRFLVEVHLLNYNETLYGQRLTVEFRNKIRPEKHFESFDALKVQIGRDIHQAREFLSQMYPL